ncbi:hypothetical protein PCE1_003036 [Barthelona sp. PCE]
MTAVTGKTFREPVEISTNFQQFLGKPTEDLNILKFIKSRLDQFREMIKPSLEAACNAYERRTKVVKRVLDCSHVRCGVFGSFYINNNYDDFIERFEEYGDIRPARLVEKMEVEKEEQTFFFEDESGRIPIQVHKHALDEGKLPPLEDFFVLGACVGLIGYIPTNETKFMIEQVFRPPALLPPSLEYTTERTSVLCIANVFVDEKKDLKNFCILRDFLKFTPQGKRVSAIILIGSLLQPPIVPEQMYVQGEQMHYTNLIDVLLCELGTIVDVIVVPGMSDPTDASLPRKPIRPLLLQNSARMLTIHRFTSPSVFNINGVKFGAIPDDVISESVRITYKKPLHLAELMYGYRHLALPTPHAVDVSPMEHDPFVLSEAVNVVLFCLVGDATDASIITRDDVLYVGVPHYDTGVFVMIDAMNGNTPTAKPVVINLE